LRHAQDDRARFIQKKHGPINQLIATLQSNGNVRALVSPGAQATAQSVVPVDKEELHAILVLKTVQLVSQRWFAG
jgi:redox-regulated HSP33 family molecular chaperone